MKARSRYILAVALLVVVVVALVGYRVFDTHRVARLVDTLGGDDEAAVIAAKNELILSTSGIVMQRLIDGLAAGQGNERDRVIAIFAEKGAPAVDPLIKRLQAVAPPSQQRTPMSRLDLAALWVRSTLGLSLPARFMNPYELTMGRAAAATALGRIGDARAVPALSAALKDESYEVVEASAKALGEIGDASALPALAALAASDKSGYVGYNVVPLIAGFKEKSAPFLVDLLHAEDEDVANRAAAALRTYGASEAGKVSKLLADPSPKVRVLAIVVLAAFDKPEYAASFSAALKDSDSVVRTAAATALSGMTVPAPALASAGAATGGHPLVTSGVPAGAVDSSASIVAPSPAAVQGADALLALLDDKDTGARIQAIIGLARLRDVRAVTPLLAALKDNDAMVRQASIRALGAIGYRRAADSLVEIMNNDPDDWLRNLAAASLRQIGDPRARKGPFQDILPSPPGPPVTAEAWNDKAVSSILDRKVLDGLGEELPAYLVDQIVWPAPDELKEAGGEPTAEARASAMKWLRKFIKPEYLPDGIDMRLVSVRNRQLVPNYVRGSYLGAAIQADFGKDVTDNVRGNIWCTANMVRFRKGDYVVQLMETPYDVIIAVGSEKAVTSRQSCTVLTAAVAKAVIREPISREADSIYSEGAMSVGRGGEVLLGMQIPLSAIVTLDRKQDAKDRLHSMNLASLGVGGISADSDGRFVRIDIEKADLRGESYFSLEEYGQSPLEELPTSQP